MHRLGRRFLSMQLLLACYTLVETRSPLFGDRTKNVANAQRETDSDGHLYSSYNYRAYLATTVSKRLWSYSRRFSDVTFFIVSFFQKKYSVNYTIGAVLS